MVTGLRRLGLRAADVVLAHSSLSSFGYVDGGADAVIDAILGAIGKSGTLMMSALTTNARFVACCIEAADSGEPADVKPFEPESAPTWAGRTPNVFLKRPGVLRSHHPTHSVSALGPMAAELVDNHENAPGPCGEETPYGRLMALERGRFLLIGVNHTSNTSLHGVEEIAGAEYSLYPKWCRIPIRTAAGTSECRTRVHLSLIGRNLNACETRYIDAGAEAVAHIGKATVRLVKAAPMREITLAALRDDPWLLVTPEGREVYGRMKLLGRYACTSLQDLEP